MKYRYEFLPGRKGKAETLTLCFAKESFFHLAGLHKTGDTRVQNKKYALERILEGASPAATEDLEGRWTCICRLKDTIGNNRLTFRLNDRCLPGSGIRADYLPVDGNLFCFVKDRQPTSVFIAREDQLRNAARCVRLTTLRIIRENLETGGTETICLSNSFRPG